MRKLEYLSHSSIQKFIESPREFYILYLADIKAPRMKQTAPMSVGSGFDAKVKSELVRRLFGEATGKFDFHNLFTKQVEPEQRDFALGATMHLFREYEGSGAFLDVLTELERGIGAPRFEFTANSTIGGAREGDVAEFVGGVRLLGKPDLAFKDFAGNVVVLDWKVNGYCSTRPTSPKAGYWRLRDKRGVRSHPEFVAAGSGITWNKARGLERVDDSWAQQLSIYSWLTGAGVGSEFVTWVEQIVNGSPAPWPDLRFASHRCCVSGQYQHALYTRILEIWNVVNSGWIFRDMSEDESRDLCGKLDVGLPSGNEADDWFNKNTRGV